MELLRYRWMRWQLLYGVISGVWVAMATLQESSVADDGDVFVGPGADVVVDMVSLLAGGRDGHGGVVQLRTVADRLLVITVSYSPQRSLSRVSDDCAYASDYLLIGNDFSAVGQELLTSYKFCRPTNSTEIVSRDAYLWVLLKSSSILTTKLHIVAKSLPRVTCGEGEMECSPVQCVSRSAVCDGRVDCTNGHDEYCYDFANVSRLLTAEKESGQGRQLLPPEGSACFLCRDGTCVLPRVSRYDWRWTVWLWYLCDGTPHCPDGWDEHQYMCYLKRHFPDQLESRLFECEAHDPPAPVSRQVRMWSLARCDGRRDCRGDGEEGPGRCDLTTRTAPEPGSKLHADPLTLSLVAIFTVTIVVSAVLVFRLMESRRAAADSPTPGIQLLGSDPQHPCPPAKPGASCMSAARAHFASKDGDSLRETMV